MSSGQVSELLGQPETVPHVLRRHKVLRHLDTAVQVVHLGGKEHRMNTHVNETRKDKCINDFQINRYVQRVLCKQK